jgi:hypothetical protein
MEETKQCPICRSELGIRTRISNADNETEICSECFRNELLGGEYKTSTLKHLMIEELIERLVDVEIEQSMLEETYN